MPTTQGTAEDGLTLFPAGRISRSVPAPPARGASALDFCEPPPPFPHRSIYIRPNGAPTCCCKWTSTFYSPVMRTNVDTTFWPADCMLGSWSWRMMWSIKEEHSSALVFAARPKCGGWYEQRVGKTGAPRPYLPTGLLRSRWSTDGTWAGLPLQPQLPVHTRWTSSRYIHDDHYCVFLPRELQLQRISAASTQFMHDLLWCSSQKCGNGTCVVLMVMCPCTLTPCTKIVHIVNLRGNGRV